jgi:hypothetical protein
VSPTEAQRADALKLANRRRSAKSEVRRRMKAGEIHPGLLLTDPAYARRVLSEDELLMLLRMELGDALRRSYRLGPEKARAILVRCRLDPHTRIGSFVNGHRATLREELERRGIWRTWSRITTPEREDDENG